MLKRSGKILLEGTLEEFKNYPKGAEGREYVLMNIDEKGPDGSYAFYEKDDKGDIIPVSFKGAEGYDDIEVILFADPEFERIMLANFNTNGKGGINIREAEAITGIGQLFKGNTALVTTEDLDLLKNIKTIPETAFQGCTNLLTVIIPNSVTNIGNEAFSNCTGLASIHVDSNNTTYDSRENCNAIIEKSTNTLILGCKNTVIPNSVTTIGSSAFSGCTGLTSIEIPSSVTKILGSAFYGCTSFTSIVIPDSVTEIGNAAFSGCTGLTSVTLGSSVSIISNSAFGGCSSLTSVTFHCNLIKNWFSGSTTIEEIVVGDEATSIDGSSFYGCSKLTSVTIGNSVTSIGSYAFYNCTGLTSIIVKRETPASVSSSTFTNVNKSSCTLYVPINSLEAYLTADYWKDFQNIVGFEPEV